MAEDFLAAVFFVAVFFAAVFFAGAFFAAVFFVAVFFTAVFFAAVFFAGDFVSAAFFVAKVLPLDVKFLLPLPFVVAALWETAPPREVRADFAAEPEIFFAALFLAEPFDGVTDFVLAGVLLVARFAVAVFFAADFFAAGCFAAVFLLADFFAGAVFAEVFFAAVFFAGDFFAEVFFAGEVVRVAGVDGPEELPVFRACAEVAESRKDCPTSVAASFGSGSRERLSGGS